MGANDFTFRPGYRGTLADRMNSKTTKGQPGDCWIWTGSRDTSGYGIIRIEGRLTHAHRAAYESTHGLISGGVVMHSCDNRACVNPAHLSVGSHQDNYDDMVRKGRRRNAKRASHPKAKLSEADVAAIRARHTAKVSYTSTAEMFGVNRSTITRIVKRENWR